MKKLLTIISLSTALSANAAIDHGELNCNEIDFTSQYVTSEYKLKEYQNSYFTGKTLKTWAYLDEDTCQEIVNSCIKEKQKKLNSTPIWKPKTGYKCDI